MKFENIRVMNFENALRGMRNPKESYHLIDSKFGFSEYDSSNEIEEVSYSWLQKYIEKNKLNLSQDEKVEYYKKFYEYLDINGILHYDNNTNTNIYEYAFIGPNDMKLACQLARAGSEHRKFLRQIFVSVDITAPLYW